MRITLSVTVAALAVVAIALLLLRAGSTTAEPEESARSPSNVTKELRARLLLGTASEFSIEPVASVWGVLMETGYPEAAATLVALDRQEGRRQLGSVEFRHAFKTGLAAWEILCRTVVRSQLESDRWTGQHRPSELLIDVSDLSRARPKELASGRNIEEQVANLDGCAGGCACGA